jgi:Transglutaminase-like superfamily
MRRSKPKTGRPRTAREYVLLLQALAAIAVARIGLLLMSLAGTRRVVHALVQSGRPLPPAGCCTPEQVVRAAVSAGIHSPVGTTCLATAIVAQAMLQRHGHESRLRLGVRRSDTGAFAAHAWLEREGNVVVGGGPAEIASYTPLPEMEHLIR